MGLQQLVLLRIDQIEIHGLSIGHYPARRLGTTVEITRIWHLRHASVSHPQFAVGVYGVNSKINFFYKIDLSLTQIKAM